MIYLPCDYRRQEELQANREEIDRQRKLLMKRKPSESGSNSRKRATNSNQGQVGGNLPNGLGGDHDHRDLTIQEYYESEEILKVGIFIYTVFLLKTYAGSHAIPLSFNRDCWVRAQYSVSFDRYLHAFLSFGIAFHISVYLRKALISLTCLPVVGRD